MKFIITLPNNKTVEIPLRYHDFNDTIIAEFSKDSINDFAKILTFNGLKTEIEK